MAELKSLIINGINISEYILNATYPIGSIFMSVSAENPAAYMGGTWVAWGSGRVPVGINTGDSNFNTVEKTGGASTHTHTSAAHSHTSAAHTHTSAAHSHSAGSLYAAIGSATNDQHTLGFTATNWHGNNTTYTLQGMTGVTSRPGRSHDTVVGGSVASTTPGNTGSTTPGNTGSTTPGNTGSSSTLQPYITCYMWKRTN